MRLGIYLRKNGITHRTFAEMLDITPNYISLIVGGKIPSRWLAKRIEAISNGDVKAKSLLTQRNKNKINKHESKKHCDTSEQQ